ncbi:ABC transporter [Microbacterium sp. Au-Mic1]|uniref:ABC transporter n=1 Tax=Microbacterium sp. Au-Mic1 TaxID=2906457 RepID=UPI001E2D3584|nr:ABC transporter [Microbacterium sp. Au-Mic1]MCE4027390.1 ABC transporter [Microbacterium sp. Au-Mic1]
MSDHEVSKPAQAHDVDDAVAAAPEADVQGADTTAVHAEAGPIEGADVQPTPAAADVQAVPADAASQDAAGEDVAEAAQPDHAAVAQSANQSLAEAERAADGATARGEAPAADQHAAVDADLAAFEAAEAAYPGTFGGTFTPPSPETPTVVAAAAATETSAFEQATTRVDTVAEAPTQVLAPAVITPGATDVPPPIFVQAPEPPRERGNRGAIFGIGLLAAIAFAILYLGTALGIAAFDGKVTTDSVGTYLLDQVRSPGLWIPVVVFAIGFWLLGGIINRGRWGYWVVFGIIVGGFAYGGHLLGAIGSVEFWKLGATQLAENVNGQLLAPLAIAAFIFGRELTIWFGAWAARAGARRTAQNEEAQREYERVLEAGPQLP